jgi:large subunit ribosomal protein L15
MEVEAENRPRWQYTPPAMKAPFSLRMNPNKRLFPCNNDPAVLDQFYVKMLGNGGHKLLSEEVKWQAVTHKSFDQGRRGYNDRLAFLGMHSLTVSRTGKTQQTDGNLLF